MAQLYDHILVPTDLTPRCREAYRVAFATALGSNARVSLLHVLPPPLDQNECRGLDAVRLLHQAAGGGRPHAHGPQSLAEAAILARLRSEVHPEWAAAFELTVAVRHGEVAVEIASYTAEHGIDLIVLAGTRPGLLPKFRGRMADRLARLTPVKIIRITPPIASASTPSEADVGL